MSGVFVSKEKAAHSGDPLTGAVHVNRDFGKGPWVRQRGEAVEQLRCQLLVLPLGVHFPSAYIGSFQLLRFLYCVVHVLSRHRTLPVVGGHVG